ncbi:ABC transporter ATP-binding protein [Ruminococcaceae bacterium OttesenSCG-928-A16]|nr:ABC transporter ATP-binding protein [Ruminococcaceae bacterium OttesenSCG-928-A16]
MEQKNLVAAGVTKKYKNVEVLHPTDITIEPGKIYGLIGRNGAGKTTLLSLLTGQNPQTTGTVTYAGQKVWENEDALGEICFARELNAMLMFGPNSFKGKHYLEMAACYYPNWDKAYAQRLIADFELDTKKKISKLSKGMMSMLTIVLALASRAPITILDEPVAGLDVAMRDRFYRLLLDDYQKTGRTFVVSTHIIEEASSVFEEIILLDKGNLVEKLNTDEYVSQFHYISGKDDVVDQATSGLKVLHSEGLGRQKTVCVRAQKQNVLAAAAGLDVELAPVPLQKIFVYVTGGEKEENLA